MRGSVSRAAVSARRAISIFSSGAMSAAASSRSRSGTRAISAPGSGSPACGSSAVILASAVASSTTRSRDSRERSEVEAAAEARPANTRSESRCSLEWWSVSISPIRTDVAKRRSSTRKPSAAVAPRWTARASTSTRRSSFIPRCPRRSCRRRGSSEGRRPPAPTGRPCRRCPPPRRAADRARRGRRA